MAHQQQRQRLQEWLRSFNLNSKLIPLRPQDQEVQAKKFKETQSKEQEFTYIRLKSLQDIQVPSDFKNQAGHPVKYEYSMQTSLSLFSNKRGFIGRTYTGLDVPLGSKPDGRNYLLPDTDSKMMQDAALFFSKYADDDMQAVIEFVLVVR